MKYFGLNDKIYTLNTTKFIKESKHPSKLHLSVRQFLKEIFPNDIILEEVTLKGFPKSIVLYCDFILPQQNLIVEADGEQHKKLVSFFHSKYGFIMQKCRDRWKKDWCIKNNFNLVRLSIGESKEFWTSKIKELYV